VEQIVPGVRVRLRGDCRQDTYLNDLSIGVRDMQQLPKRERVDLAPEGHRRVELHMHSTMSAMDATTDAAELVAQAARWGHPAVAITDHGVTQASPPPSARPRSTRSSLFPGSRAIFAT
jgi:DNA polymerase-3 subunit alpha (Gram-positive type)